jgi:hypothetical protein
MSRLRGSHAGLSPSPTRAPERAEQEEPETGDRITLDSGRVVTLAIDWSSAWREWLAIDDQTYDYDPDPDAYAHPVGTGETRQAAVDDLLEQIGDEK